MTHRRARAPGCVNGFTEEHGGTNQNKGAAGGWGVAPGSFWSWLHRSGDSALRAECRSDRAGKPLWTWYAASRWKGAHQAPPPARAERRSEANAGNSRHASRRRKVIRQARQALGRKVIDSRVGRSPELARREEGARGRARSQSGDVRPARGGRGRRCGGSGKTSPQLPLGTVAGGREHRRVRSSGDVDRDFAVGSPARHTSAERNGSRPRHASRR